MRAIYYEIQTGDTSGWTDPTKVFIKNLVYPENWTSDPIWGNPGKLTSPTSTGAFQYHSDTGTSFYLIVHFQRVPTLQ